MRTSLCLAAVLLAAPACAAPVLVLPPALRQAAAACFGEALRLCPDALGAADHGLSCIRGKRRMLSAPCRPVYDQGLRLLSGRDLHLVLRPPGKR